LPGRRVCQPVCPASRWNICRDATCPIFGHLAQHDWQFTIIAKYSDNIHILMNKCYVKCVLSLLWQAISSQNITLRSSIQPLSIIWHATLLLIYVLHWTWLNIFGMIESVRDNDVRVDVCTEQLNYYTLCVLQYKIGICNVWLFWRRWK